MECPGWCVPRRIFAPPWPDERSLRSERGAVINNKSTQNIPAIYRESEHAAFPVTNFGNMFDLRSILHLTHCAFTRDVSRDAHNISIYGKGKGKWRLDFFFFGKIKPIEYRITERSHSRTGSRTFPRTRNHPSWHTCPRVSFIHQ